MVCIVIFGILIRIDFTAPFLLGLLSLTFPPDKVMQTAAACLLHESAHILIVFCTGEYPQQLTISAAGMQLTVRRGTLCPAGAYSFILLSGPTANLIAGILFLKAGLQEAALANLSLFTFNLLPMNGTDGGSLLRLHLDRNYPTCPEKAARIARLITITAALAVLAVMHFTEAWNFSLLIMILYLTLNGFLS